MMKKELLYSDYMCQNLKPDAENDTSIYDETEELISTIDMDLAYIEGIAEGEDIQYVPPKAIGLLSAEEYKKLSQNLDEVTDDICKAIHRDSNAFCKHYGKKFYVIQENSSIGYSCRNYESKAEAIKDLEKLLGYSLNYKDKFHAFSDNSMKEFKGIAGNLVTYIASSIQKSDLYCGITEDELADAI